MIRSYLYSPDCPTGRIFEGADAIADAEKDGWVESPAMLVEPQTKAVKAAVKPPAKPVTGGKKAKGDHSQ